MAKCSPKVPLLSVVLPIFFSALLFGSVMPKTEIKFVEGAENGFIEKPKFYEHLKNELAKKSNGKVPNEKGEEKLAINSVLETMVECGYEIVASAKTSEPGAKSRTFLWTLVKNDAKNNSLKKIVEKIDSEKREHFKVVSILNRMDDFIQRLEKKINIKL